MCAAIDVYRYMNTHHCQLDWCNLLDMCLALGLETSDNEDLEFIEQNEYHLYLQSKQRDLVKHLFEEDKNKYDVRFGFAEYKDSIRLRPALTSSPTSIPAVILMDRVYRHLITLDMHKVDKGIEISELTTGMYAIKRPKTLKLTQHKSTLEEELMAILEADPQHRFSIGFNLQKDFYIRDEIQRCALIDEQRNYVYYDREQFLPRSQYPTQYAVWLRPKEVYYMYYCGLSGKKSDSLEQCLGGPDGRADKASIAGCAVMIYKKRIHPGHITHGLADCPEVEIYRRRHFVGNHALRCVAEYRALLIGLKECQDKGYIPLIVRGISRQVNRNMFIEEDAQCQEKGIKPVFKFTHLLMEMHSKARKMIAEMRRQQHDDHYLLPEYYNCINIKDDRGLKGNQDNGSKSKGTNGKHKGKRKSKSTKGIVPSPKNLSVSSSTRTADGHSIVGDKTRVFKISWRSSEFRPHGDAVENPDVLAKNAYIRSEPVVSFEAIPIDHAMYQTTVELTQAAQEDGNITGRGWKSKVYLPEIRNEGWTKAKHEEIYANV
jgi:hypothetical protein